MLSSICKLSLLSGLLRGVDSEAITHIMLLSKVRVEVSLVETKQAHLATLQFFGRNPSLQACYSPPRASADIFNPSGDFRQLRSEVHKVVRELTFSSLDRFGMSVITVVSFSRTLMARH